MASRLPIYVPLRCRSPYSMLEGAMRMGDTAKRAREWRLPAIGLADTNSMCGALEFSGVMIGTGIQPIMGCTLSVDLEGEMQPGRIKRDPDGTMAIFAQNETGYENLMSLSSAAFLEVEATDLPHIKASRLEGHTEGVIALTGGPYGALNRLIVAGQIKEAEDWLDKLIGLFPNRLYVEL
ncbi:MAG: PHP domain-containing protein, partial [Maricaulaceae bacterium]